MRTIRPAARLALAATTAVLATATVARADDMPFTPGNYVEVTDVSIDDGHFLEYMKFLDTESKAQDEFAKSQGWMLETRILGNVHKRANEADIFILRTFKALPDAAEQIRREKISEEHFKQNEAQFEAASGARAKFRKIGDTMLLQELILK
ncbi:MAG: hypothetical protein KGN34_06090 [Sphingomonadales bacterium]|nr:hypothetical protein [Sphingomonadales bacterium]